MVLDNKLKPNIMTAIVIYKPCVSESNVPILNSPDGTVFDWLFKCTDYLSVLTV